MNRTGARIGAFVIGIGAAGALALGLSSPAMASDHPAKSKPAASTTHHTSAPQRHVPSQPRGHQPPKHHVPTKKARCTVHCPKATSKVVSQHTSTKFAGVVKHNGHLFLKKITYRTVVVRHTSYTASGHKCVKHTSFTKRSYQIGVRYTPVKKPVWHKPGDKIHDHQLPAKHHS